MHECILLAYLDPGAGSIVLQALVGGFAGLFVFIKCAWDSIPFLRSRKSRDTE